MRKRKNETVISDRPTNVGQETPSMARRLDASDSASSIVNTCEHHIPTVTLCSYSTNITTADSITLLHYDITMIFQHIPTYFDMPQHPNDI